ncbi:hypothetical protein [Gemmatimonas sp.]|uniref:hypothetical protein n=1 Tax=Gemmatimonas sp. TaxID=1962908 RepID=UPI0035658F33
MSLTNRCIVLLLLLCPVRELGAQSRTRTPAMDVGLGLGRGVGGPDVLGRGMLSGSIVLSKPVRALSRGVLVAAAHASANLLWQTHDCINACRVYPSDASLGALGGWAIREDQGSGVRLLAGPGYFITSESRSGIGLTARLDGAERMTARLSFVFWAQAQLPPAVRGERLAVTAVGIGVRVH